MENINNFVYRKLQISEGCETHMGNGVIQPCVMIIFTLRFEDNKYCNNSRRSKTR